MVNSRIFTTSNLEWHLEEQLWRINGTSTCGKKMESDIPARIPRAYLYGGCHKYPSEMLACVRRLLLMGHAKEIHLTSCLLPPPLTCVTEADEGRSPYGCTPLPEITVGLWLCLRSCEQPRVTPDKWPEWRTWALMFFVTSGQWWKNAQEFGRRDGEIFPKADLEMIMRSKTNKPGELCSQDFLIPQSQHDTHGTSLAFGQDLWSNQSPPAGTLLVCAPVTTQRCAAAKETSQLTKT